LLLHSAERGLAGQVALFADRGLQSLIKTQRFMIVQVLVSGSYAENPLTGHGFQLVANQRRVS